MLKHNQHSHLFQCRIYRILFILFLVLVLFTIYPILDAYADSPDSFNYSSATIHQCLRTICIFVASATE